MQGAVAPPVKRAYTSRPFVKATSKQRYNQRRNERHRYEVAFIRGVLEFAQNIPENSSKIGRVMSEFHLTRSVVVRWLNEPAKYLNTTKQRTAKSLSAGPKVRFVNMEEDIFAWVKYQRARGLAVNFNSIIAKAMSINPDFCQKKERTLVGWCERFSARHHLVSRKKTKASQKTNDDVEVLRESFNSYFCKVLGVLQADNILSNVEIWNMDQTPVYFDMPLSHTMEVEGTQEINIKNNGCDKQRVTVCLCISACGN
eukprot:Pompholyxophrys_sp_v1_NODE_77_length_2346_cov_4.460733.p1 type:complete len:256 gc:universal NODE_77_length_2346_cov_4.460733:1535-2302(+)